MGDRLNRVIEYYRSSRPKIDAPRHAASEQDVQLCRQRATQMFGRDLDADYYELSRVVNGLGSDGNWIYPTHILRFDYDELRPWAATTARGIIEANEQWRTDIPEIAKWILYGQGEMSFFVFDPQLLEFQIRGNLGLRVYFRARSFEDMVWEMFRKSFDLDPDSDDAD